MDKIGYIYSGQMSLWGSRTVVGFGCDAFSVRVIDRNTANEIIRSNHYSGVVYNGSYIHLGVFAETMVGVLQFGPAMNPASQASVVVGTLQDEYLELNRMWIDDCMPRNTESKSISYAIKFIKKAYPKIAWIQSFADERCGRYGVVYQACNFVYCGEHTSVFWELDGEMYHNSLMTRNPELTPKAKHIQEHKEKATPHRLRQFRYVFFIKKSFKERLALSIENAPKHGQK